MFPIFTSKAPSWPTAPVADSSFSFSIGSSNSFKVESGIDVDIKCTALHELL